MRLRDFLGIKRNVVLLLIAIVVIGSGEELWMRFLPKYMQSLGAAALAIGLFDALKTLLGAVYAYPGGILTDRWGHRRALVLFTALSILGYAVVLVLPSWQAVIAGMFLFVAWSDLSLPATFSLVGADLPAARHSMGIGMQSLIKRIPILIAPIAGGMLIDRYGVVSGVRLGVAVSIGMGGVAVLVQRRLRERAAGGGGTPGGFLRLLRNVDPALRRLLGSDILIRFCERIPYAWVVIYALDNVGVSAEQVGILTAVEVLVAMACYVPAAHFADRYGREPFVIATFVFFTLFPVSLLAAHSFGLLLVAFAVRGLKEFGEPARKALIISYAPEATRARTVGAYYLVRDVIVTAGSFLGAALWQISPQANFLSAAGLGALGTVLYSTMRSPDKPGAHAT